MGLESPSFVNDLVTTNPEGTDARSQGDDHIRNLKSALKATFPNASVAHYFPTTTTKSADFTVASTDQHKTFYIDSSLPTTSLQVTLPVLTSTNAGWLCTFIRVDTSSTPIILLPGSGTLQSGFLPGLARVRRAAIGIPFSARWTGSTWVIDRCFQVPVGAVLDVPTTQLPAGTEWANGQALTTSLLYPEFFQINPGGLTVTDRRGRASFGRDDMGGSAAGRITASSGITGTSLGASGGFQTNALTINELPTHSHTVNINDPGHSHTNPPGLTAAGVGTTFYANAQTGGGNALPTSTNLTGITATTGAAGSGAAFAIMPPAIISNHVIVVE